MVSGGFLISMVLQLGAGGTAAADAGTHCVDAFAVYSAGAERHSVYLAGPAESETYVAGSERGKVGCH